jgi:methyl-accepting chemotaxis protein
MVISKMDPNHRRSILESGVAIAFGLVLLVTLVNVPIALWALFGITKHAQQLHDVVGGEQLAYARVAADASRLRTLTLEAVMSGNSPLSTDATREAQSLLKSVPDDVATMNRLAARLPEVSSASGQFVASLQRYVSQERIAVAALAQGRRAAAARTIAGSSSLAYDEQIVYGRRMLDALGGVADARYQQLRSARNFGIGILLVIPLALVAIVALTLAWLREMMLRGIGRCAEIFEAIGRGDLCARTGWSGDDVLGRLGGSVDTLARRLAETIAQIQNAMISLQDASHRSSRLAQDVAARAAEERTALSEALDYSGRLGTAAGTVAENADGVARRVSDISSSVAQMDASIAEMDRNLADLSSAVTQAVASTQQMSASIAQVAGNAERVRAESSLTDEQVRESRTVVLTLAKGMRGVNETVASVVTEMQELDGASREIDKILGLIENIADQTNLLALNAAIEAARAGEHGRGFAVVADEVRKLAEDSGGSTKQIAALVADIQRRTKAVLERTAQASALVQNNSQSVDHVTTMIEQVGNRTAQVALLTDEISVAAVQQARGSEELAKASERMGAMTHEASATMREQSISSNQILSSVSEIERRTSEVARASGEQRVSIEALGSRIRKAGDLGAENADSVGSMASTAGELQAQTGEIKELVGRFRTGRDGEPLANGRRGEAALEDPGPFALSS